MIEKVNGTDAYSLQRGEHPHHIEVHDLGAGHDKP